MHFHAEVYLKNVKPPYENDWKEPPIDDRFKILIKSMENRLAAQQTDLWKKVDGVMRRRRNKFWDWWVIGGRWSGSHLLATFDQDKVRAFEEECNRQMFHMSAEKTAQTQREHTEKLFRETFPDAKGTCPYWRDTYSMTGYPDDLLRVEDCPEELSSYILLLPDETIATDDLPPLKSENGCVITRREVPVREQLKKHGLSTGWLVTVDYHS